MKQLQFVNDAAQKETRDLPASIRSGIGFQLLRVQRGEMPADFKPMPSVGSGVLEIRVKDDQGNNTGRCFYVTKFGETIWVLHSFVKKSRRTSRNDIEIGRNRYQELLRRIEKAH